MARKKVQVHYCDFCSQPIHNERHIVMVLTESDLETVQYGRKVAKKEYEICTPCKNIMDELFRMRKANLKQLVTIIENSFRLPYNKVKSKTVVTPKKKASPKKKTITKKKPKEKT